MYITTCSKSGELGKSNVQEARHPGSPKRGRNQLRRPAIRARRSIHELPHGHCPFYEGEWRYGRRQSFAVIEEIDHPMRLNNAFFEHVQTYHSDDNCYNPNGDSFRHGSSSGSYNPTPYHASTWIQEDLRETEQNNTSDAQQNGLSSTKNSFFVVLVGIICVILAAYYVVETKPKLFMHDIVTFSTDLHMLGCKYNVSGDSILKVQSGIVTIFYREGTGSFLFVYNSKSPNFQKNNLDRFINEIASTTAKILRNYSPEVRHIVLESSDLHMRTHYEFMNTYRDEVDKTGVLVVKELENVPSSLAMAFHYYCDECNPLVKKSAIFFTMDLGNCSSYNGQDPSNAVIEKCLSTKWQNVPQYNIAPLLSRVVGFVVDVSRMF